MSFFNSIAAVLQGIKARLDIYFSDLLYHLCVTPQTFSLQKMLNDKFDKFLRRIRIDIPEANPIFYFYDNENVNMRYFSKTEFFYNRTGFECDFTVIVPLVLKDVDREKMIIALLNKYKLLSKTFKIIYV